MKFEFSAGGVVFKRHKGKVYFALVLNPYKKWTFPKGRIEKPEKPEQTALREVSEELGVDTQLKIIELIEKIDYWYKEDNELIHKFVYFYLIAAPSNTNLNFQKEEVLDAQWFEFHSATEILGYPKDDLKILKKAFQRTAN